MSEQLKPCPFCGRTDLFAGFHANCLSHMVECRSCSARIYGRSTQEAIAAWNNRVKESE